MAFTYFFRDYQTLEMIREFVLPVIGSRCCINIWSAGCAMGQELYYAMLSSTSAQSISAWGQFFL